MAATSDTPNREEFARLGKGFFQNQITPSLEASDFGKYVASDIESGSFELDSSSYEAVMRLRKCHPSARIWLARVGHPAAVRI